MNDNEPRSEFRSILAPLWKTVIARALGTLDQDTLIVRFPDGDTRTCNHQSNDEDEAVTITIRRWRVIPGLLFGGSLRFAEDYMAGHWTCDHLAHLVEIVAKNAQMVPQMKLFGILKGFKERMWHRKNANSLTGSRKNVAYHYDLGNDFYSNWLDETMTYSSALFDKSGMTLDEAQVKKYERLARSLDLKREDKVLEIGCGWGGFADYAAKTYGCHITCITLSEEQAEFASQRMEEAGLNHLVEIRLQDYREVEGEFDKIVSIEMFEAVGEEHWSTYFKTLFDHLVPKGRAALQIITIGDEHFDYYRRQVDFIQRYIFPGGMLPSLNALKTHVQNEGLALIDASFFGKSYARTLHIWREKFLIAWPNISSLGFDQTFRRMWTFYLASCEGTFKSGRINVGQFVLEKP